MSAAVMMLPVGYIRVTQWLRPTHSAGRNETNRDWCEREMERIGRDQCQLVSRWTNDRGHEREEIAIVRQMTRELRKTLGEAWSE